jgi:hypothetical protein
VSSSSSKLARVNQANQARKIKKLDIQLQKRLGSNHGPPRIVALVPITASANSAEFFDSISSHIDKAFKTHLSSGVTYVNFANLKAKCAFIEPKSRDLVECLNVCKSADAVVLLSKECIDSSDLIDEVPINVPCFMYRARIYI